MSDEKIYFQDEHYVISSKRLVICNRGQTLSMDTISEPSLEVIPLKYCPNGDYWILAERWAISLIFGTDPNHYRGALQVLVKVNGKKVVIGEDAVYHQQTSMHLLPWGEVKADSPEYDQRVNYWKNLAIAVGAALAGT